MEYKSNMPIVIESALCDALNVAAQFADTNLMRQLIEDAPSPVAAAETIMAYTLEKDIRIWELARPYLISQEVVEIGIVFAVQYEHDEMLTVFADRLKPINSICKIIKDIILNKLPFVLENFLATKALLFKGYISIYDIVIYGLSKGNYNILKTYLIPDLADLQENAANNYELARLERIAKGYMCENPNPQIAALLNANGYPHLTAHMVNAAIAANETEFVQDFHRPSQIINPNAFTMAVEVGNINIVRFLANNNNTIHKIIPDALVSALNLESTVMLRLLCSRIYGESDATNSALDICVQRNLVEQFNIIADRIGNINVPRLVEAAARCCNFEIMDTITDKYRELNQNNRPRHKRLKVE